MKIRKNKETMHGECEERIYDFSGDDYSAQATNPDLKKKAYEDKVMEMGSGNTLNCHTRVPTYEVAGNEVFLPDKTGPGKYCNAYITFGHDRPNHLFSGYGGQGGTRCSTIDICAGSASSLKPFGAKKGVESYGKSNVVGKIFAADASRIYISQMTDVDANFGLPMGNHGDSKGTPAIAIKSDHVRIIGRSSIKLYAGSGAFQKASVLGEKSGAGGGNNSSKVIELIASDVRGLEPVVKGTRLLMCLSNVYAHIAKLYQRALSNNASILSLRSAIILHFHPAAIGVTFPDAIGAALHAMSIPGEVAGVIDNVTQCLTSELDKAQYLGISPDLLPEVAFTGPLPKLPDEPAENKINSIKGMDYILSSNVFTT